MSHDRISKVASSTLALLVTIGLLATACAEGEKATPVPKKDRAPAGKEAVGGKPGEAGAESATSGSFWPDAPGYDLFLGEDEDPDARVFQSPDFQKLLVLPGAGEEAFLLTLKKKEVTVLPRTDVTATIDGALISESAQMKPAGALVQNGAELSFPSGGATARLAPEPPLIGVVTAADLMKKKKDYSTAATLYKPNGAALSLLKSVTNKVEITVFFGTWCHYCKKWLPRFLKVMDAAANPNITYRLIGIDEDLTQPEDLIRQYGVSKTPTFIVKVSGQDMGRIVEEPKKSMEEDLTLLLLRGK